MAPESDFPEDEPEFLREARSLTADGELVGGRNASQRAPVDAAPAAQPELQLADPAEGPSRGHARLQPAPGPLAPAAGRRRSLPLIPVVLVLLAAAAGIAALRSGALHLPGRTAAAGDLLLLVDSTPPDADVYLDGELAGRTPLAIGRHALPGSTLEVRVEKRGFRPAVRTATLEERTQVRFTLQAR
jgi:hypothetical protein